MLYNLKYLYPYVRGVAKIFWKYSTKWLFGGIISAMPFWADLGYTFLETQKIYLSLPFKSLNFLFVDASLCGIFLLDIFSSFDNKYKNIHLFFILLVLIIIISASLFGAWKGSSNPIAVEKLNVWFFTATAIVHFLGYVCIAVCSILGENHDSVID